MSEPSQCRRGGAEERRVKERLVYCTALYCTHTHREQVALERAPRVEQHAALGTREMVRHARRLRELLLERQAPLALVDLPVHYAAQNTEMSTFS